MSLNWGEITMSWSYMTNAWSSSLIAMLIKTIQLTTLLAVIIDHTVASDLSNTTVASVLSNTTENIDDEEGYIPYSKRPETYFVPIIFLLIFIIGFTGNSVLAFTIIRHSNMRNIPNMHILSLAIGDLLVIACLPFTFVIYVSDSWPFGLYICKFSECAKDISVGVSIFTLTALSLDRFFAIANPMRKLHVTGDRSRRATCLTVIVIVLIWVSAITCAIPAFFSYVRVFNDSSNVTFQVCYPFPIEFGSTYPKVILASRFFIYYLIPLGIITVFYLSMARHLVRSTNIIGETQRQVKQVQARKKVASIVMAFVVIFAVCFLPQHVFMLWFYFNPTSKDDYNTIWHYFRILGLCLAYVNSCIDPIALYFMSGTFRKYFDRYLFRCAKKRMRKRQRSSDLNSRGRRRSSSFSLRENLDDSRREQRSMIRLSTMASNIKSMIPIKEQETTL